jgi:mannosyl-oligosaccharide alpha-1,3-glucosidase
MATEKNTDSASFFIGNAKNMPSYKVVLNYKPFRVDVYSNDELIISVNSRQLFKFEHFRNKIDGNEDGEGFWEETFKGHTDTKPFGSSSLGLDVSFIGYKYLYGLPEHSDTFALRPST